MLSHKVRSCWLVSIQYKLDKLGAKLAAVSRLVCKVGSVFLWELDSVKAGSGVIGYLLVGHVALVWTGLTLLGLQAATPLQGVGQGAAVGVLDLATKRHPMGNPRHLCRVV